MVKWLNKRLIQFGEELQSSNTKALNVLKTKVFIIWKQKHMKKE